MPTLILNVVVARNDSKQILEAIVSAYPAAGVIVGISIARGWGRILNVEIATKADDRTGQLPDSGMRQALRSAVSDALVADRSSVQFVDGLGGLVL